jgi:hypothetical protein
VADAKPKVPSLSAVEVRELYRDLLAQYSARNAEYHVARERYNGRHWDPETNPEPNGRYSLTANYIRPTVDKSVEALVGTLPGIQVMPPGVDELARRIAEAEEALLYATWDVNDAELVFRRVAHNMVLLRRGLIYYWWDPTCMRVKFRSFAPDNYFPIYDGEDTVECVLVSRRNTRELQRLYPSLKTQITPDEDSTGMLNEGRQLPYLPEMGESDASGIIRTPIGGQTTVIDWYDRHGNWVRLMGDAEHSLNLAYGTGRVPIIEFNNNIFGDEREPRNDVDDIIELNQYLDQLISQQADVIRKYSNPTVVDYGSGQSPDAVKRIIQNPEGGVLPARKDARLEYLNWTGTPADFETQYQRVMSTIFDLSGKPASSYGQTMTNQSGVVTNLSLNPVTTNNAAKESLMGSAITKLNEDILRLYEKFSAGEVIEVRGMKPKRAGLTSQVYYEIGIKGKDISGWYKNRVKWPSALRTDDPVYVQNELAKMASDPPVQSIYTTLENLGVEDVEAELDRVKTQLEDPRFHPDRLSGAIEAANALQGTELPADMGGFTDVSGNGGIEDEELMNDAAVAGGSPNRDELVSGY